MVGQLCQVHWTEDALVTFGIHITPRFIDDTLRSHWEFFAKGLRGHVKGKCDIDVFLSGARKVVEAVNLAHNYVRFQLDAVNDRELLPKVKFVIIATNLGKPVFEMHEMAPNVVTLSLAIDDMLGDYVEHLLAARGLFVADNRVAME
ncbi:hypothetical protein PanWU01x14_109540 [Parasponia andersonii]|uniref:Uncharacterized protein n=1 Tax=Parasponia andersonii TaxID=3476 RepID=A0A2P5CZQ4_PARAD|nr:hypothetical protein PanWU01x14_109540 [Parasponia andersonii]